MAAKAKIIEFHVPEADTLAALGEVALRHEQMNHVLRLTIKSLANITVNEAIDATMYAGSKELRERARKLARKVLGEGTPLLKLQAILANCERLTKRRNDLVHGLWAQDAEGAHLRDASGYRQSVPTVEELRALAQEVRQLAMSLNFERLKGFLMQALQKKR
jgi:hypothetical protein